MDTEINKCDNDNESINHQFSRYSQLLDHLYNKKEKIFKLNRDLTRESKKIIFALHGIAG